VSASRSRREQLRVMTALAMDACKLLLRFVDGIAVARRLFPQGVDFVVIALDAHSDIGAHAVTTTIEGAEPMRRALAIVNAELKRHSARTD